MKIAVGSDHRGLSLKRELVLVINDFLSRPGSGNIMEVVDVGTHCESPCDYTTAARKVAGMVSRGEADMGILICGTGLGVSMVANKYKGVRAARCVDTADILAARSHNNANVLCLSERGILGSPDPRQWLGAWFSMQFHDWTNGDDPHRHKRRIEAMDERLVVLEEIAELASNATDLLDDSGYGGPSMADEIRIKFQHLRQIDGL